MGRGTYSPPGDQDDPRVCGARRRHWGSVLVPPLPATFVILNTRTGKYHSGGEYGETDCGRDATGDDWLWPL